MIENSSDNVKRYAPPVHRNRSNRRKSGGEKNNISGVESGKRHSSLSKHSSIAPTISDQGDTKLVPLERLCTSEAVQFLNDRWTVTMQLYNDPSIDPAEKPVIYTGASGSSWGHMKLPHQMDFLGELRRMMIANTSTMLAGSEP